MGPTNNALVNLFKADQSLREIQTRLDSVTKNVRAQERKVADLLQRQTAGHDTIMKTQAKAAELDLEVKSRDARIEALRTQQQVAQTSREYQAFLSEINTHKVDRGQFEEQQLKLMEQVEKMQADHAHLSTQLETERTRLTTMQGEIGTRVKDLGGQVEALQPARDAAAATVPQKARDLFERLADRFEGEAMAPIEKPHPKREEYICSSCNLELMVDVYNRLRTRDEPVMCPSNKHMLYIPEEMTNDNSVNKPKAKKPAAPRKKAAPKKAKDIGAPVPLQTLAGSVVGSVDQDDEDAVVADAKAH